MCNKPADPAAITCEITSDCTNNHIPFSGGWWQSGQPRLSHHMQLFNGWYSLKVPLWLHNSGVTWVLLSGDGVCWRHLWSGPRNFERGDSPPDISKGGGGSTPCWQGLCRSQRFLYSFHRNLLPKREGDILTPWTPPPPLYPFLHHIKHCQLLGRGGG